MSLLLILLFIYFLITASTAAFMILKKDEREAYRVSNPDSFSILFYNRSKSIKFARKKASEGRDVIWQQVRLKVFDVPFPFNIFFSDLRDEEDLKIIESEFLRGDAS